MSKVFAFLADGLEEVECLAVVDVLRRAGAEVTLVSVTGSREITGSHHIHFQADALFDETAAEDADVLFLPGGMPGTNTLKAHEGLKNAICKANKQGRRIGKGEHPDWGTKIFNYEKSEVRNFLIANALFWLNEYHVDGLRVDAVASMLYLDYGKQDGQWVPNKYGGKENLEAIWFFKHLNSLIRGRNDGAMIIAEESTAWPGVTKDVKDDGLGFTFKWNMGWMNDFLEYMKLDPYFRKDNHNKMTFAMSYACSENYILVLSHDEVVHLKCSMINKMPGYMDDKFANLKAGYAFMFGHSGKKLLFMGNEFAQLQEWSEERELDWFLLKEERHQGMQNFVKALLHMYKKYRCLYELDDSWDGFQWINADDCYRSIFSFVRYSKSKRKSLLFVVNFTPMERPDYRVGVPKKKKYKLILDSDAKEFGGKGRKRPEVYEAKKGDCDNQKYYVEYPLGAYGVAVFEF